jgi:predicted nucleic acid-binding protein
VVGASYSNSRSDVSSSPCQADARVSVAPTGEAARRRLAERAVLQAPAILRAEAISGLRRLLLAGELRLSRARTAIDQVRLLRVIAYPFEPFIERVWQLRSNLTVYDAWYAALAEWLDVPFVTADERLASISTARCEIEVIP